MRKIIVFVGILLTLMIIPTGIFALQNPRSEIAAKTPEEIALAFLRNSPTFIFDGITSTLVIEDMVILESYPLQYVVTISFESLHGGYGDRSNQVTLQAITPHTAVIKVISGKVTSAIIDGVWDEVAQKTLTEQEKAVVEAIALNWLINAPTFKFDGILGSVKVVDSWLAMTFAAPSFWGVTIEFDCLHSGYGDRTGKIIAQAITHHVVMIHVTEGSVNLAQIDNIWDELKQQSIEAPYSSAKAEETALNWLFGSPTFKFDGIPETVKIIKVITLRMPNAWDIYVNFTCQYPGYGDRTGNVMLGHSQVHTIRITVIEGQVNRAIIDDKWDEIEQKMIESNLKILTPEEARDIAIDYYLKKLGLAKIVIEGWVIEDLTPNLLGVQKTRYSFGDWIVTVENAVVWKPIYTVTIQKAAEANWICKVDSSDAVVSEDSDVSQFITPDVARKLCLDFLLTKHTEINVRFPLDWTEKNLVPEGIVGLTKIQYTSSGWTVTVKAPVVWKPTYTVIIEYSGSEGALTWEGLVPQDGQVQETFFSK